MTALNSDVPDECVATGESCSYERGGPDGEWQCKYCGSLPPGGWMPEIFLPFPEALADGYVYHAEVIEDVLKRAGVPFSVGKKA